MQPMRSLLFVPGHREDWPEKAVASGADGIILDLEDSVPTDIKPAARDIVAKAIQRLAVLPRKVGIYVRINALESGLAGDDIEKIVIPGLDGIVPPKVYGERDIIALDALISHYEHRNGVVPGTVELFPTLETAQGYAVCEKLLSASSRMATLAAGTARDADVSRAVGFEFTPTGLETLYLRSRVVLAVRASGRNWPLVGLWQDLNDSEGARYFAEQNRQLGFRGQLCIHPSHVKVVNEVFTPSEQDVLFYRGMINAFSEAERTGLAAVSYEGHHIDYAHVKTAKEVLALHRQLTGRAA